MPSVHPLPTTKAATRRIALKTHLPSWLLESPDMQALWRETNLNIVMSVQEHKLANSR